MIWDQFKKQTEALWVDAPVYSNVYGYQIQPGTKWNTGMMPDEIQQFEQRLGFCVPNDYKNMLISLNGFDRESIDVQGDKTLPPLYSRRCYKYPDDLPRVAWLLAEIAEFRSAVDEALIFAGFKTEDVIGFVPIFGHRALVVFNNPSLSPVISVVGDDVIIYGNDLAKYVRREFFSKV